MSTYALLESLALLESSNLAQQPQSPPFSVSNYGSPCHHPVLGELPYLGSIASRDI